jgi:hypothetical protein
MVNSANAFVATIRATREKTARLKALRLAKEAQVHTAPPRAAKNSSSLNFTALHPSYAVNSAPPITCAGEVIE